MAKPGQLKIEKFAGLNNVDPPEEHGPGDFTTLTNVDIDDTGEQLRRRKGYTRVYSGSCHSLFNDGSMTLFREGAALKSLSSAYAATTLRSGLVGNQPMAYLPLNDRIYYGDGIYTGVIDEDGTSRTWGLAVPYPPVLAQTAGELAAGRYQVALTYLRTDGQESGSSPAASIDITQGGITVSLPTSADPTVEFVTVYITATNGEVFYHALSVANGTASVSYRGRALDLRYPLRTQFLDPAPAGHLICFYNGRIYIAQGNILWYSEPYAYELFNLAHNHKILDSRITLLSPATDGIWVGTQTSTDFLIGEDAPQMKRVNAADYGVTEKTAVAVEMTIAGRPLSGYLWASPQGICFGGDQAFFQNLTEKRFYFASSQLGAAILRQENGMNQYLLSMLDATGPAFNPYLYGMADLTLPALTVTGTLS